MQVQRILIVDDETSLRTALFRALDRKGYQVITAGSREEALNPSQADKAINLALIDLRLPDGNGIDLMNDIKALHPKSQFIILTGFGSIENAIAATKNGAEHFITKPFELGEVISIIEKIIDKRRLEEENSQLRSELHKKYHYQNIIGQSEGIQRVHSLVERVSTSDATVLVTGESGTGKELVAKAIHYNSERSHMPFVPINCGAIPSELLESELFGHIKGAFTGAINNRVGRFEMAEGGTIFFDEIGDMPASLQVKLLRVLQERKFEPVGSTKTQSTNVRVIAATNVNLEKAVQEGKFREDLYYRLNVIPIEIPSLKERRSDIPLLFQHFLNIHNQGRQTPLSGIGNDAMECLLNYSWPGNIRELENLVERLVILKGSGMIENADLPNKYRSGSAQPQMVGTVDVPDTGMDFNSAVDAYENKLILKALEKTGWNRNQAATLLKLNRTTLVEKIKKKGLKPSPELSK